jgi:hypothetical protein
MPYWVAAVRPRRAEGAEDSTDAIVASAGSGLT